METTRVGIISDTHGLLRPEVFRAFEDVDRIIHAGDIGDPDILVELEAIAPVTAVWGNTDSFEIRSLVQEVATLSVGGLTITVIHGQQFGRPTPTLAARHFPGSAMVVFGHSHVPAIERHGSTLALNPGSSGPRRFRHPVTVAIATIREDNIDAELVNLLND